MLIKDLVAKINLNPESITFQEVIACIEENYHFTSVAFTNGNTKNEKGTNAGSCKIFSFAQLNQLTKEQTLACFGDYYRIDVLTKPEGTDHANIRNFIEQGFEGLNFEETALVPK